MNYTVKYKHYVFSLYNMCVYTLYKLYKSNVLNVNIII